MRSAHGKGGSAAGLGERRGRRGFTLLETSMALVIIGVGVLAFVEAQKTFVQNNSWSSHTATATLLANEIRERMRRLPRHDPVTGLYLEAQGTGTTLQGWGLEAGEIAIDDFDDIDDYEDMRFGVDGDLPGPIDAFGNVIPELDADGVPVLDERGDPVPLQGWSQTVTVEKVDPFNFATARAPGFFEAAAGAFPGRSVDQYPLRVTVMVEYQGPYDTSPREVARVFWIAPP
ncbi:MAG: prepilin-type N-terminal cleavage/methylation domain-containing protein [Phycisphaerales bacterium]|nr:prepilin-type N-terminal cleavage/methylation domain-containing protein [Phycisphaerales bacterium]